MDTQSLLNPQCPVPSSHLGHKRAGQAKVLSSRLGRSGSQKVWLCLFLGPGIVCCVPPATRRHCCNSPARAWSYVTGCRRAWSADRAHDMCLCGAGSRQQGAVCCEAASLSQECKCGSEGVSSLPGLSCPINTSSSSAEGSCWSQWPGAEAACGGV